MQKAVQPLCTGRCGGALPGGTGSAVIPSAGRCRRGNMQVGVFHWMAQVTWRRIQVVQADTDSCVYSAAGVAPSHEPVHRGRGLLL